MRAVMMTAVGGPEVLQLRDIQEPELTTPTSVKVKLHAAGINPVDTKIRSRGLLLPGSLPAVLGLDGAGEVTAVGAQVTRFKPGDRVWFCDGGLGGDQGCYAEYKALDQDNLSIMPPVDYVTAAAGPLVLITAWEALFDRARLQPGQTVLIHAGAGGVGHVAIQMARLRGARVATTAAPLHHEWVQQLGAEKAFDYHASDLTHQVLQWTQGEGVDIVFDTVGGRVFELSMGLVKHYGDLVTLLEPDTHTAWKQARVRNARVGFVLMLTPLMERLRCARDHQAHILSQCAQWVSNGKLYLHVHRVYSLSQADVAHADIAQSGKRGKLVLTMDS